VFGSSEGFARKRKCYSDDEEDDKENSESEFGREKRKRHREFFEAYFVGRDAPTQHSMASK
jgi:hypothetical protein